MEIQGRIIAVLPMKSGRTAKGEWKVQQYVLETDDKYGMLGKADKPSRQAKGVFNRWTRPCSW